MVVVSMLKRKDAASVVVAVVVGLIIFSFLSSVTDPLASSISSRDTAGDWQNQYLYPTVLAALELIALEILGWIYIWANSAAK